MTSVENTDPGVKMKFSASSGSNKSFLGKISMASCKQDSKNLVLYFYKIEKFSPFKVTRLRVETSSKVFIPQNAVELI